MEDADNLLESANYNIFSSTLALVLLTSLRKLEVTQGGISSTSSLNAQLNLTRSLLTYQGC